MSSIRVNATLVAAPPSVSGCDFPSSTTTIYFGTVCGSNPKPAPAQTGAQQRTLNSPSSYSTLKGVGANDSVLQANTFYFSCRTAMKIQLTFADTTTAIIPVNGTLYMEFDPSNAVVLIGAQGTGSIEWFASGTAS